MDVDATDVEHYLINNPDVFADLVDRHQNILPQQPENGGNENIAEESEDEEVHGYVIPRLNLGLHVNREAIAFTRINNAERFMESDSDDDSDEEVLTFPNVGVGMRVMANAISISRISEFEEDD